MKTSKVASVEQTSIFETENGVDVGDGKKGFFKHEYVMEDKAVLTANHKTKFPFPDGTEVEYEIKGSNDYGSWGKVGKPSGNHAPAKGPQKGSASIGVLVGHAINNGVLLAIADGDPSIGNIESRAKEVYRLAHMMEHEIATYKKPATPAAAPQPEPMPTPKAVDEAIDNTQEEDLPF